MGQYISAIVTNQIVEVPKRIVHFEEYGCIIIPLDISTDTVRYFIKEAIKYKQLSEILSSLRLKNYWMEDEECEHSLQTVVEIIELLRLNNFIIEHHSEHAGLDIDLCFMAIIESETLIDSAMEDYETFDYEKYEKYKKIIGLHHYWFSNENRYYFYSNAREDYDRLMEKL